MIAELGTGEINSQLSLLINDERTSDLRQAVSVTVQRESRTATASPAAMAGGVHMVTPPMPRLPLVRLPSLIMKVRVRDNMRELRSYDFPWVGVFSIEVVIDLPLWEMCVPALTGGVCVCVY